MTHAEARRIIIEAWRRVHGRAPTWRQAQLAQGWALGESHYGRGWREPCAGSRNWGAVQRGRPPCPAGTCEYTDTSPQPDGTSVPYQACFRMYSSDVEGAEHMIRVMRRAIVEARTPAELARRLYEQGYYEGWGTTPEARVRAATRRIEDLTRRVAKALGEPWSGDAPRSSTSWLPLALAGSAAALAALALVPSQRIA